ncbi:hypothetical protein EB233_25045 [Mesorhizobium erdmanii]|uniref:L,D-TPase catalytic domain-containing protein n=1 Tax=Mesorhizobium erdmanii TaxID=1777866 RepID=A0A6M7UM52_9HYPH|nr:hypothetical protein EB233_25045 [Mesorhizobium erdmanii]
MRRRPGTGTSSTWFGCSCSPPSTSGDRSARSSKATDPGWDFDFEKAAAATWPPSSFRSNDRRSIADAADNSLCGCGWLLQLVDWTDGCIAITDSDMDEIWAMVADGTPIKIEQ